MTISLNSLSLNALRTFEASARHLSFTRAGEELCVTQAAISHQIKTLEDQLGAQLFRRTTRGLVLTDEGAALAPVVADAFARLERGLNVVSETGPREILTVGVVGTFAGGFLLRRVSDFQLSYPQIDLRLQTNNNKVDLWTEGLDLAIRFGDGSWHGVDATQLMIAPISPLCTPAIGETLRAPLDLASHTLLRSYRARDWPDWLEEAGAENLTARGPIFDASIVMVQAAIRGEGVALAPPSMFQRELSSGELAQPFSLAVNTGAYWLTRLISKEPTSAMATFKSWLTAVCA